jgi:hypothetical protein
VLGLVRHCFNLQRDTKGTSSVKKHTVNHWMHYQNSEAQLGTVSCAPGSTAVCQFLRAAACILATLPLLLAVWHA